MPELLGAISYSQNNLELPLTIDNKINITLVESGTNCEPIRQLLRTFVKWHFERHVDEKDLISEYFDKLDYEKELNELPGKYIYPDGALLLAYYNTSPAGCVALKRIDNDSCEMKRMFVYEQFHGLGVGKQLAKEIVTRARQLGFKFMKLDTSFRQLEAQQLYKSIGFKTCNPYYDLPERLRNWLVFMELDLRQ
jgi:putative acetyltransferase